MPPGAHDHPYLILRFLYRFGSYCGHSYPDRAPRAVDVLISRDWHNHEIVSGVPEDCPDLLSNAYDTERQALDLDFFIDGINGREELVGDAVSNETGISRMLLFSRSNVSALIYFD